MSQDVLLTVLNFMSLIGETANMDGNRKESCNLEAKLLKSQNTFNDLLKRHSQLEKHCISLEFSIQLNQELFQKRESYDNQNALEIPEFFENNDLKAQPEDKDSTICKLKDMIKSMRVKSKDENVKYDYCEIETKNVELENRLKCSTSKYGSKPTGNKRNDRISQTTSRNMKPKVEIAEKVVVTSKNKDKKVRFAEPLTSLSNNKHVESSKTSDSNTPVLSSTGLKCSTSNCGSNPTSNKKNDRISRPSSRNMKNKVEAQPRKVNKKNRVVEPICDDNVKHSKLNAINPLCATCCLDCSLVSGLWMFETYDREPLSAHELYVDLLSGSRDTNLYTISLDDMLETSRICILSKASKTKSWFWHRRLSLLNFACALGKSMKFSHQPKAEDTNQEKLCLLHMDLCGPMRVASINGKSYPTNDNDDLGKLDAKADIGIFVGYVPAKKAFRIYNKRTQKIIETIYVTFDELTAMASKQFSSGPGLHSMTPATSSSGLCALSLDNLAMPPHLHKMFRMGVAIAKGCRGYYKRGTRVWVRRGSRKIRIPIDMYPCRVKERFTIKLVKRKEVLKIETTVTAKDSTITKFLGKFPEYKPTKEEEEISKLKAICENVIYDISDSDSDLESTARSGPRDSEMEDTWGSGI
ncbi:hypothetical protein Tco_0122105 [Tanacetum coccineum]